MFQHIVCILSNRQVLFVYVQYEYAEPDLIQLATKFMVVVTSLFNLAISSFHDNMFCHAAWLNRAVDLS